MAKKYMLQIRIPEEMKPLIKEFRKKARSKGENPSALIRRFIRMYTMDGEIIYVVSNDKIHTTDDKNHFDFCSFNELNNELNETSPSNLT
ncbi:MAG: hypothetical protein AB1779_11580 [Candidatus Thermoplasmatota archaeon]